jgi:hypothetical protein
MKYRLLASVAVSLVTCNAPLASERVPSIVLGIAASDATEACVAFPDATGIHPQSVGLVIPERPQRVLAAALTVELQAACKALHSADLRGPYFRLDANPGNMLSPGQLGIVLLTPPWTTSVSRGRVHARSKHVRSDLQFRACTSTEGIHLTAWQGLPLQSGRTWHAYVYLGYDVEPSCTTLDTQ